MDTTILIRTKKDLKVKAQKLAKDLGFSLSDIINASMRQFVINQGIQISKVPTSAYLNKNQILKELRESQIEIAQGKGKVLKSLADLD